MEALPAQIAMQMAMTQQNVAMSMLKKSAESERAIANILSEAIRNVPVSGRGGILNTSA